MEETLAAAEMRLNGSFSKLDNSSEQGDLIIAQPLDGPRFNRS